MTHLRYNDVTINFSYAYTYVSYRGHHQRLYVFVGYGVVPEFDMGKKKTIHREAVVVARGPLWDDALQKIADGSTVYVKVELTLKNKQTVAAAVAALRIRFDDVKITLYYANNQSFSVVGYGIVPGFKQAWKITAHREAVVEARGAAWDDALRRISQGSTVELRAELITGYRKITESSLCICCTTVVAGAAELQLDSSGEVSKKPIRFH
ncbi:hypothetical protein SASPL_124343 [Salvia splendens]|uniref:Uncharacterized protein n=1 Tax=Salvia splendens TaxID=180675 RepID=A0A8X8XQB4_SALSN|nr:hypothetical protein SASPL_124343 [Salvia splendens]